MAQVLDFAAAREARQERHARAVAGGLARLTQWDVKPDGSRERKEWAEMRARAAKPFQFRGVGL